VKVKTLLLLAFVSWGLPAYAERSGNFDIFVQELRDEDARTVGQGINSRTREMTQNLTYKVRIDYKGIDKLKDVQVMYVIAYRPNQAKPKYIKGKNEFSEIAPLAKMEFKTIPAENIYTDQISEGLRFQTGKSRLEGICIKIFSGKDLLTEWSQPKHADKYWDDPSVKDEK